MSPTDADGMENSIGPHVVFWVCTVGSDLFVLMFIFFQVFERPKKSFYNCWTRTYQSRVLVPWLSEPQKMFNCITRSNGHSVFIEVVPSILETNHS